MTAASVFVLLFFIFTLTAARPWSLAGSECNGNWCVFFTIQNFPHIGYAVVDGQSTSSSGAVTFSTALCLNNCSLPLRPAGLSVIRDQLHDRLFLYVVDADTYEIVRYTVDLSGLRPVLSERAVVLQGDYGSQSVALSGHFANYACVTTQASLRCYSITRTLHVSNGAHIVSDWWYAISHYQYAAFAVSAESSYSSGRLSTVISSGSNQPTVWIDDVSSPSVHKCLYFDYANDMSAPLSVVYYNGLPVQQNDAESIAVGTFYSVFSEGYDYTGMPAVYFIAPNSDATDLTSQQQSIDQTQIASDQYGSILAWLVAGKLTAEDLYLLDAGVSVAVPYDSPFVYVPTPSPSASASLSASPLPSQSPSASASPLPSASASPLQSASTSPLPSASASLHPSASSSALPSVSSSPLPSASSSPLPPPPSASSSPLPPPPSASSSTPPSASQSAAPSASAIVIHINDTYASSSSVPQSSASATPAPVNATLRDGKDDSFLKSHQLQIGAAMAGVSVVPLICCAAVVVLAAVTVVVLKHKTAPYSLADGDYFGDIVLLHQSPVYAPRQGDSDPRY